MNMAFVRRRYVSNQAQEINSVQVQRPVRRENLDVPVAAWSKQWDFHVLELNKKLRRAVMSDKQDFLDRIVEEAAIVSEIPGLRSQLHAKLRFFKSRVPGKKQRSAIKPLPRLYNKHEEVVKSRAEAAEVWLEAFAETENAKICQV